MDAANLGDPAWTVSVDADPRLERVAEALCSLADGRFGTRGSREEDGAGAGRMIVLGWAGGSPVTERRWSARS